MTLGRNTCGGCHCWWFPVDAGPGLVAQPETSRLRGLRRSARGDAGVGACDTPIEAGCSNYRHLDQARRSRARGEIPGGFAATGVMSTGLPRPPGSPRFAIALGAPINRGGAHAPQGRLNLGRLPRLVLARGYGPRSSD